MPPLDHVFIAWARGDAAPDLSRAFASFAAFRRRRVRDLPGLRLAAELTAQLAAGAHHATAGVLDVDRHAHRVAVVLEGALDVLPDPPEPLPLEAFAWLIVRRTGAA